MKKYDCGCEIVVPKRGGAEIEYCSVHFVAQEAVDALVDIRDLARTGTAPDVWNMTELQWTQHKLNRIAGMAHKIVADIEGSIGDDSSLPQLQ